MSNFYLDNPDLAFRLEHAGLQQVVRLREDDYAQARDFTFAPKDYEDALDSFRRDPRDRRRHRRRVRRAPRRGRGPRRLGALLR